MPASIDIPGYTADGSQKLLPGTQFVDLNGDGRLDFILSKEGTPGAAWENTGEKWVPRNDWILPVNLATAAGLPSGAILADFNGDGLPDLIQDNYLVLGVVPNPIVWLNRTNIEGGLGWELNIPLSTIPGGVLNFTRRPAADTVADLNGDGKADIIRLIDRNSQIDGLDNFNVYLSTGTGWTDASSTYRYPTDGSMDYFVFKDINGDGLADRLSRIPFAGTHNYPVAINTNDPTKGAFGTVWSLGTSTLNLGPTDTGPWDFGDLDGDGMRDAILFHSDTVIDRNSPPGCTPFVVPKLNLFIKCNVVYSGAHGTALYSMGTSYTGAGTGGYASQMTVPASDPNYQTAFADLNADGLVDKIRLSGQGTFAVNTGTTWQPVLGTTIPIIPDETELNHNGAAFVDLDGDGVVDLVRSTDDLDAQGNRISQAWLNKFRPPVITRFPNGVARKTELTYLSITTKAAKDQGTYTTNNSLQAGTKFMAVPLRVVASVSTDNAVGADLSKTTYSYFQLRASTDGRGPQGFAGVTVTDPTGMVTATYYAQAYPYTGLPTGVVRYNQGGYRPRTLTTAINS